MTGSAFTARTRRWKALASAIGFAALLAYLLLTPGYGVSMGMGGLPGLAAGALDLIGVKVVHPVLAVLGEAVLALAVAAFLWRFFASGIRVRVDARGILDRDFSETVMGWDEIERACVALREGRPLRAKLPMRLVWGFDGHRLRREVPVSMLGLDRGFDELLDAVERFRPGLIER